MDGLTEPDPELADEIEVMFAPAYQFEWLLGPEVEVIFTPEGWDE